jgi:glycosyltransferase involved in cell wall biosynthesis
LKNRKPRVLIVGEFSQFNTGFATYFHYLLPRLFKTEKYELCELAVYLHAEHPKNETTPWAAIPNEPSPNEPEEFHQAYRADPINQFGKFRFNQACLEFLPDFVVNIADPWMASWINDSPYRKRFKYIHMPTVDGQPQKPDWMEDYGKCDVLLTYSEFGKHTLETQSGGNLKVKAVASPAADIEIFRPSLDKNKTKEMLGLPKNSVIIQTVMRNQPRKLFPEILKSFNSLLAKLKTEGKNSSNVFLHFHTSNPDMGWDLPAEIKNHGLSHKVFLTYMCDHCGLIQAYPYRGDKTVCPNCQKSSFRLPNTSMGCTREQLGTIMSAADVYLQYSICEGFGMPIVDAKACGVPTVVVGYSAMREMGTEDSGGLYVNVGKFWQEPNTNTNQLRAVPDNSHCVDILYKLVTDDGYRQTLGKNARAWAETYYNWDRTAKIWENVLDTTPIAETPLWFAPLALLQPITEIPKEIRTNEEFIYWVFSDVLKNPKGFYSQEAKSWITWLAQGHMIGTDQHGRMFNQQFTPDHVVNAVNQRIMQNNQFEQMRVAKVFGTTPKANKQVAVTF